MVQVPFHVKLKQLIVRAARGRPTLPLERSICSLPCGRGRSPETLFSSFGAMGYSSPWLTPSARIRARVKEDRRCRDRSSAAARCRSGDWAVRQTCLACTAHEGDVFARSRALGRTASGRSCKSLGKDCRGNFRREPEHLELRTRQRLHSSDEASSQAGAAAAA